MEFRITLEFDEPCLGNERFDDPLPNKMLYNSQKQVIFRQVWWDTLLFKAIEAFKRNPKNKDYSEQIRQIMWRPEVKGEVKLYKRWYYLKGKKEFKVHESFLPQDRIVVHALVPENLSRDEFKAILEMAGSYFGISPFGWKRGVYGKFHVISVEGVGV